MKHLTIMLKPASSLCNLRCKYCFYADITSLREVSSFGVMKESAMTAVMDHIFIDLDDGDYLTLSFQGGEPMLAGLPFYRNLVQYIAGKKRNIHINYTLQTNGILLDDDWCKFLAKYGFLIGIPGYSPGKPRRGPGRHSRTGNVRTGSSFHLPVEEISHRA